MLGHDLLEREALDPTARERRGDGQRPQDEVGLRRDEGHVHPSAGELVQREHRLEGADATADDDDAERLRGGRLSS